MTKRQGARVAGGALTILAGVALAFGGFQLWNGAPSSWADVTATRATASRTAMGVILMAAVMLVAGTAATLNLKRGFLLVTVAMAIFVAGSLWVNYILFADIRPLHTGTNVLLALLIEWLLWVGYSVRDH